MDQLVEALVAGGLDLFTAIRLLIPAPWEKRDDWPESLKAFYHYHHTSMEPWDGPAGLVFTDGRHACCALDRNGLRPVRWMKTKNGWVTMASEMGVWPVEPKNIEAKGQLNPGDLLAIDQQTGQWLFPGDINQQLGHNVPYASWLETHCQTLQTLCNAKAMAEELDNATLLAYQKQFRLNPRRIRTSNFTSK